MPKLSDSMADAVILRWLKSPGDAFTRGEALIEVETDKATVVYEAEADGTLGSILVPEGETASIGEPIATLANGDGAAPAAAESERANATPVARRTGRRARRLAPRDRRHRRGRADHARGRRARGSRVRHDGARACARAGKWREGRRAGSRVDADAGHDRAPDGRVGDHDPVVHGLGRHRHVPDHGAAARGARREPGRPVDQRLRREGGRGRAEGVPALQRLVRRRQGRVLLARERRRRGRHGGRAAGAGRPGRRREDTSRRSRRTRSGSPRPPAAAPSRPRTCTTARSPSPTSACSACGRSRRSSIRRRSRSSPSAAPRREPVEDDHGGVAFRDLMTVTLTCDHRVVYGADGARFLSRLRELLERPLALTL